MMHSTERLPLAWPSLRISSVASITSATSDSRNGAPGRLSDVADVIDAPEDIRNEGQANGKRSVLCIIYLQPNANIIETVAAVKAREREFVGEPIATVDL